MMTRRVGFPGHDGSRSKALRACTTMTLSMVAERQGRQRAPLEVTPTRQQLLDIADRCPMHRAPAGEIEVRTQTAE